MDLRGYVDGGGFFAVYPREGVAPPFSDQQLLVEFRPAYARRYTAECLVDVEGKEQPLSVTCIGVGLGPDVSFEKQCLDVGDIYVSQLYKCNAQLINKGDIEACYKIVTRDNALWKCTPENGTLPPHQSHRIEVNA